MIKAIILYAVLVSGNGDIYAAAKYIPEAFSCKDTVVHNTVEYDSSLFEASPSVKEFVIKCSEVELDTGNDNEVNFVQ